jgi:predicted transglutaminase-like cysteine proteinase
MATLISAGFFLLTDEEIRQVGRQYGQGASGRLQRWQQIMTSGRNLDELKKVDLVNGFFNRIPYQSDLENYGIEDYWATPIELLVRNAGDCEDYAIAKYFTLRELGVAEEKLKITYVVLTRTYHYTFSVKKVKENHMVLTYYPQPDGEPLVLDNFETSILPAGRRYDLSPVYSFNGEKLWSAKEDSWQWGVVGHSVLNRPWREFSKRLAKQLA